MKPPCHGIRSTTPKHLIQAKPTSGNVYTPLPPVPPPMLIASDNAGVEYQEMLPLGLPMGPNIIIDDCEDHSVANVFAYAAFADKNTGTVYNNLTVLFPFVSLDGSVCFFVLYHYESNSILADSITGLDDKTIFEAYKKKFKMLTKKGFKPKLNVMDNQATKYIKQYLDENKCRLQLVEPHNHHVNAAEQAIQTFKDAFIAALATTDRDFPIQLWDRLTSHVQNT
jgi:hypothetical protein